MNGWFWKVKITSKKQQTLDDFEEFTIPLRLINSWCCCWRLSFILSRMVSLSQLLWVRCLNPSQLLEISMPWSASDLVFVSPRICISESIHRNPNVFSPLRFSPSKRCAGWIASVQVPEFQGFLQWISWCVANRNVSWRASVCIDRERSIVS